MMSTCFGYLFTYFWNKGVHKFKGRITLKGRLGEKMTEKGG